MSTTLSITQTDLNNCDLEPIHIPGKIQSHGFLLVTDNNFTIKFISTNASGFIGHPYAELLDKPLTDFEQLLDINEAPGFLTRLLLHAAADPVRHTNPLKIKLGAQYFNLIISPAKEYALLEFEPIAVFNVADVQHLINKSIPGILEGADLSSLLHYTAAQVKSIIQFDRVMIYRFAADGHGEVVAEAKNDNLDPWLGLHSPASDIPKQARELYKINITRSIADVHTEDAFIAATDAAATLDLTFSQLRAVSPIHIQYLKNMGVASSYSISLMYQKELWGLIACHNYTARFIDYEIREASKLVGQILSAALEFRQHTQDQEVQAVFQRNVSTLSKYLNSKLSFEEALTLQEINLLDIVHATGAVLFYQGTQFCIGKTPNETQMLALVKWIGDKHPDAIFYTDSLCVSYLPAQEYKQVAAGMMVVPLLKDFNECIIWFKEEIIEQVRWAGDPSKPVIFSADGMKNISPRHSFDTWTKDVRGKSAAWLPEETDAALQLKEEILTVTSSRASANRLLNERLHAAYEELDTFSYTISHDLKTPLTAIKGYAEVLAFDSSMSEEGKQMLQRITDRAEKMNVMIKTVLDYSRIGRLPEETRLIDTAAVIKEIIEDMEHTYQVFNVHISTGKIPSLRGDPVMIWQVFSNLIGNAVKYSQYAAAPAVHIEGWTSGKKILYSIRDNGIGIAQKDLDNIFLLFSRMSNTGNIEGTGVGLAIVKKIVEKHAGIIWAESELGVGTTFFLSFTVA